MLPKETIDKLCRKEGIPWTLIPNIGNNTLTAIGTHVYVPSRVYENLLSTHPDKQYLAILEHEFVHIDRQRDMGVFKWILFYLISNKFRIQEEIIADRARMEYLAKNGEMFDIEHRARQLSSWLYLYAISYEQAKEQLENVWKEINTVAR